MKNEMLAHIAGIKSEVTALEAEILMLPGEIVVAAEDPGLEVPDDLEPPLEPPLPPVITLPMHVRDVKLSADQVKLIERLTNCSTFKPGGTREAYNLDGLSKSGRLNDVSRHLSLGGVAVAAALRFTGRPVFLERLYTISQNLRGTLVERKGFLGWVIHRPGEKSHGQVTPMESLMAHAFVAQLAWAFYANAGHGDKFGAEAAFWREYLLEHFLGYWEKRTDNKNGPLHIDKNGPLHVDMDLAHPYAASIRLCHYLSMLTSSEAWEDERDRRVNVLMDELFLVGDRYVVGHFINAIKFKLPLSHAISHANYFGEFITSIADLGFEGVLSETVMTRFARTINFMIDGKKPGLMKGANGEKGVYHSPLFGKDWMMQPMVYPRGTTYTMQARGYALMSYFDRTGEIAALSKQVDDAVFCQPIVGQLLGGAR